MKEKRARKKSPTSADNKASKSDASVDRSSSKKRVSSEPDDFISVARRLECDEDLENGCLDQTTANQERELREIAAQTGCEIVKVYKDHGISGAKGRDRHPAFDALCRDAAQRKFDMAMGLVR
jgi:hypothetical protein